MTDDTRKLATNALLAWKSALQYAETYKHLEDAQEDIASAWKHAEILSDAALTALDVAPERGAGWVDRKNIDMAAQEIRDCFAHYGSGDYTPTEDEKEIIELTLDNILIDLVEKERAGGRMCLTRNHRMVFRRRRPPMILFRLRSLQK